MKASKRYQYSEKHTPVKQDSLRHILKKTMAIIRVIYNNPRNREWARQFPPLFLDLFAGPGRDPLGGEGSPLIILHSAMRQNLPFNAHFFECDPQKASLLQRNVLPTRTLLKPDQRYTIHEDSNKKIHEIFPRNAERRYLKNQLGIAYFDPSDADVIESARLMWRIAERYEKVDLIFNIAATSWKRQRKEPYYKDLIYFLSQIPKKHWLIRRPISDANWTMLYGTNYIGFGGEEKNDWFNVMEYEGREMLNHASYIQSDPVQMHQLSLGPRYYKGMQAECRFCSRTHDNWCPHIGDVWICRYCNGMTADCNMVIRGD